MDAEARFAGLVDALLGEEGVSPPASGKAFGSGALKVNGRIFAMLSHGHLVLKLPRARVDELVVDGHGTHFDGGKGKPMKEWFALSPDADLDWLVVAREALTFVRRR